MSILFQGFARFSRMNHIPYAINGLGQVVGEANIDGIGTNATFYMTKYSEALLLSSLVEKLGGWSLIRATDINDAGEIIGYGNDLNKPDSDYRVFKLVPVAPVPEPSTWLIIGSGSLWIFRKFRPAAN